MWLINFWAVGALHTVTMYSVDLDDIQEEEVMETKHSKKELSDTWQHMT